MNVVVIGGNGFIGSALVKALATKNYNITSISRSPSKVSQENVSTINCNYDNTYLLGDIYEKADIIFHLASDTTPTTSSQQCLLEGTANLIPLLRLTEFLERKSTATLIYLSSGGAIYGDHAHAKCSEATTISPRSHYGAGKAAAEAFVHSYQAQTTNRAVILRPSNIYGPGQYAKQSFGVIPTLFQCISTSKVFHCSGLGEHSRDYLYIDDFINLCTRITEKTSTLEGIEIYNCGRGEKLTLNNLIKLIQDTTQVKLEINYENNRPSDVHAISLDSTKAIETFNWKPRTSLKEGIEKTWSWWKTSF